MDYKKRLNDLRTDKDLSQEKIAKYLGITKQAYGMYENGKRTPGIEDVIKLSKFYNVSTDYILGLTDGEDLKSKIGMKKYILEKEMHFYDAEEKIPNTFFINKNEENTIQWVSEKLNIEYNDALRFMINFCSVTQTNFYQYLIEEGKDIPYIK